MLSLLFYRPIAVLLTIAGATVLAPVILPAVGAILKPLVKPVTDLYLDLADEIADAIVEHQEQKGLIKPDADKAKLKKRMEKKAELAGETAEVEALVE